MSRRPKTSPSKDPAAVTGPTSGIDSPQGKRRLFLLAAGVAAIWGASLLLLAVTTANPVTLNRAQVEQADDVVTATIEDPATGTIDVTKFWKQAGSLGRLTVGALRGRWARSGAVVLIPLTRDAENGWHITQARLPTMTAVRTGATISAAGRIVEGEAVLRQASSTGDGNPPVRRKTGDRVAAGMIVVEGSLRISTTREGPPLIYPATDDTRDQLREILAGKL